LGRIKEQRQILVTFTSFAMKLEALRNNKHLAGSKIEIDEISLWKQEGRGTS
jgi:hypothetical protein